MRLDDFDPNDINVGSQGNRGGGGFGFGGGGGGGGGGLIFGLLPLIGSRFGCGGIVVVLILMAVFSGQLGNITGGGAPSGQVATRPAGGGEGGSVAQICNANQARHASCNAFASAQDTWEALAPRLGVQFEKPSLQFFDQNGQSGCGAAQAAMGPFYCPLDQGIYLDTGFFDELTNRFHAAGDFAQYYVVAHEFGHHIQKLMGTSDRVHQVQQRSSRAEGNAASVRLELQADCYAGVWAAQNRNRLEPGDVEEGMRAAQAIGDDTLQREATGNVNQESFTHGTSAQRMHWLQVGLQTGDPRQCDTFNAAL